MTHFEKLLEQIRNDELASEIEVIVEALNDEAYEQGHADGYNTGYMDYELLSRDRYDEGYQDGYDCAYDEGCCND